MASNDIIEPNFEGEEMKMPEGSVAVETILDQPKAPVLSGPVIILLGLILAVILGGLGYWYHTVMSIQLTEPVAPSRPTDAENNEPESTTAEARTGTMDVVSTSNELGAIAADVTSTNLEGLDAEVTAIDSELEAAMSAQ